MVAVGKGGKGWLTLIAWGFAPLADGDYRMSHSATNE